jgi:hypothetical protein
MSQEDKLAKAELEWYDESRLEVPYNNYGTRGVVDFVGIEHVDGWRYITATEFKSESAVRNATGANEIIRQFTRQVENFASHKGYGRPNDHITHVLAFYATQEVVNHITENLELYQTVRQQYDNVGVCLKHPDADAPLVLTNDGVAFSVGAEAAIEQTDVEGTSILHYS